MSRNVIIIGSAYPLRGGLSNFNERLAEEFLNDGWQVEIYTFSLQYPSFLFPGKTQYSTEPYRGNINIKVAVNSVNPLNWIKVGLEIKNKRADLIIIKFWLPFMAPCFGTIARIARSNNISKVVTIIDNIIPHEARFGDKALAQYFSNSIDGFVTMSRKVMQDVSLFDTSKPRVFSPHPIYDNFGSAIPKKQAIDELKLSHDFKYILFFGFIRDYKGLDILLSAMADNVIRDSNIKLIVAGEFYTNAKPYIDFIANAGIVDKVILSNDFIPDSEVYRYFCAADIVVQPYKNATQSGVTQIAYHFDKPMIITNVGGLGEFVPNGEAGYVVNPDSQSITEAIARFYSEEKEFDFVSNVKVLKQKYSWKYFLSNLKALFGME